MNNDFFSIDFFFLISINYRVTKQLFIFQLNV